MQGAALSHAVGRRFYVKNALLTFSGIRHNIKRDRAHDGAGGHNEEYDRRIR
ncbi:hypothetical protein HMPREF9162_0767 [Selenomonas sp. oral taxon 137 str. F0430]|nr:hypothetical protein HMPREF9162_0767 [Selenomonas sp. oral taxon 137 str. F0430]EJP30276.1 hypothetical protein HMPREF1147_2205 [Selenomonas sp. FOBRC9]